ncbi:MAG: NAD(P)-dependent iron-only hydrogenase iron-sulfur protein [Spirochaetales bacterium]|nr:MAG: NAD(P)-dependent iron-only hydrogenase iron-sulfur protein [Spirochaetales bacterium]
MAKMTLEQLRKLREEQKQMVERRDTGEKSIHVIVGMGTCGIAAGAKEALNVFLGEAYTRKLDNIVVKQTGCMGLCHAEPTVEVKMEGMPDTLYGHVNAEVARKIVENHILGGKLVNEHVFDYPAQDIRKE